MKIAARVRAMTVFRNRKTAERSGAENMLRYLFEFRFVAIRLRIHIAEAIAARGTRHLQSPRSARYLTQQGQMMNGHKKTPRTRGV